MNRVCLNMIVRNEAHIVRRCLDSVRPFIDSWCIVDTGSTDDTQQVIREHLRDLPGELHERPWKDFGHNRSEAFELARAQGDFVFSIDADEVLECPAQYVRPALTADAYALTVDLEGLLFSRTCLVASRLPWRWVGVLHEYLDCAEAATVHRLQGLSVIARPDGARSRVGAREKYRADARLLETALAAEPDNTRYAFYLAQSYRDCGEHGRALQAYDHRAAMGGWTEEVWYSRYCAALAAELCGRPSDEVLRRYVDAFEFRPQRAETPCQLARWLRLQQRYASARLYAARAMTTPMPADTLFLNRAIYEWRSADEYAVASYWSGDHASSAEVFASLLGNPLLPAAERARVLANLNHSRAALKLPPVSPA